MEKTTGQRALNKAAIKLGATLLLLVFVAPVGAQSRGRTPELGDCEVLRAPAGHRVAFVAYAEGVQIYQWNGTTWSFTGPEAVLYSPDGEVVGIHYGGPTWESLSGSKVRAAVVERCTPDSSAIPWLLLQATSSKGPGVFRRTTYIQRLYTTGGLAPAEAGDFVGDEARVPYTAWYVFYRKQR